MKGPRMFRKVFSRIWSTWPLFPHLLLLHFVSSLCWHYSIAGVPMVLLLGMAYLYVVDVQQRKYIYQRLKQQWKFEQVESQEESNTNDGMSNWLNKIIAVCWPAWEGGLISKTLQSKMSDILVPYNVTLERLRLGSSPPLIKSCSVEITKMTQNTSSLYDANIDMDISFVSGEDMGVVLTVPVGYFSAKLFVDSVMFGCKMKISFKCIGFFPYISHASVCFVQVPSLSLSVRPLSSNSIAVTDLPIIASWVSESIHMAVKTCGLVHPEKLDFDFLQWWGTDYGLGETMKKRTANGCYVMLEVIEGRNLVGMDMSGLSDPYVIVKCGNERFKTEVQKQTLNPSWRETFVIPLTEESDHRLLVRCRDKDILYDDEMGFFELDLRNYSNGRRTEVVCKLKEVEKGEIIVAVTLIGLERNATLYKSYTSGQRIVEEKPARQQGVVPIPRVTYSMDQINDFARLSHEQRMVRPGRDPDDVSQNMKWHYSISQDIATTSQTNGNQRIKGKRRSSLPSTLPSTKRAVTIATSNNKMPRRSTSMRGRKPNKVASRPNSPNFHANVHKESNIVNDSNDSDNQEDDMPRSFSKKERLMRILAKFNTKQHKS